MEVKFVEKNKCVYLIDFSADFPYLFHYELMKSQILWGFLLFFLPRLSLLSRIKTPDSTQRKNKSIKFTKQWRKDADVQCRDNTHTSPNHNRLTLLTTVTTKVYSKHFLRRSDFVSKEQWGSFISESLQCVTNVAAECDTSSRSV